VIGGRDLERVAADQRAAMGRRSKPDDLRAKRDRRVITIPRYMLKSGNDRHVDRASLLRQSRKEASFRPSAGYLASLHRIFIPTCRNLKITLWKTRNTSGLRLLRQYSTLNTEIGDQCDRAQVSKRHQVPVMIAGKTTWTEDRNIQF
jgi:hypothetical protein